MNIKEDCQEYVDLLNSAPNGWGQHIHPKHGESHWMLHYLFLKYGKGEVDACLDTLWK